MPEKYCKDERVEVGVLSVMALARVEGSKAGGKVSLSRGRRAALRCDAQRSEGDYETDFRPQACGIVCPVHLFIVLAGDARSGRLLSRYLFGS